VLVAGTGYLHLSLSGLFPAIAPFDGLFHVIFFLCKHARQSFPDDLTSCSFNTMSVMMLTLLRLHLPPAFFYGGANRCSGVNSIDRLLPFAPTQQLAAPQHRFNVFAAPVLLHISPPLPLLQ
jgi:hypothetical protein